MPRFCRRISQGLKEGLERKRGLCWITGNGNNEREETVNGMSHVRCRVKEIRGW